MFDAKAFFENIGVPFSDHDDTPKVQPHWVGVKCPFCNTEGPYLGYSLRKGYFSCWRCGGHSVYSVVEAFLGPNKGRVLETIKAFQKTLETVDLGPSRGSLGPRPTSLELPYGIVDFMPAHKRYLERRKFDPNLIHKLYGVQGTGPFGPHARRLFMPITLNDRPVSWTTRDITKSDGPKYVSCPLQKEVIPHKRLVYGIDKARSNKCVIVEGPTDVWRMGPGAVATFGIKYTKAQVKLISKTFDRVFVLYDNEDFAIRQAKRLARTLSVLGLETEVVALNEGDPGDLPQTEADYLMVQLLR